MTSQLTSVSIRSRVAGTISVAVEVFSERSVVVARTSSNERAGALSAKDGESLARAGEMAHDLRLPLVLWLASSGADVGEGMDALDGWGRAAHAISRCSGVVPIIAVAPGPLVSGPALLLGLSDLVIMTPEAGAFVSGPNMVEAFTGVAISPEDLGGTRIHAVTSGLCTLETNDPAAALGDLLSYLPNHADEISPRYEIGDPPYRLVEELREIVPASERASYDMRDVARSVGDEDSFIDLWAEWAPQIVTGFLRLDGRAIGVVANQPRALAGTLDIAASQKGARFVRLCDAFNLPILTLVDTPGFLPGKDLEWRGMIRHGAELAFAYAEATVPRLCVIVRKAYGGAYIVMDSKGLGNDLCVAWPGAEIAVMGAQGAAQILYRRTDEATRAQKEEEYKETLLTPYPAAERGFVDAVIDPAETRAVLVRCLSILSTKRETLSQRRHDAGPL